MTNQQLIEVPIQGMDCADCAAHVQHAIAALPGIKSVDVLLASEKAMILMDHDPVDMVSIRKAVEDAGYSVPDSSDPLADSKPTIDFTRVVLRLFGIVFSVVLFVVVVGEWFGLFEIITNRIPWPVGLILVLIGGYPIFRNVLRAALKGQVISHTLMSLGAFAALLVGQWATAVVVVFFMRVGDYAEHFTTERSRRAVKSLTQMSPQTARIECDDGEQEVLISAVAIGQIVVVRPGEMIPVDGEVISGQATIDQAAITGESMPVEVGQGSKVFAATIAQLGSIRIRTGRVGTETTFGRVLQLVAQAEANRAQVQRIADKFSAYYLPVVTTIAVLTLLLRHDPLAAAAVTVVACSCSFALATPIAMLASIGAAAKVGILIKGGKYIEILARADVLLIDKTGTLTLGKPTITDIVPLNGLPETEILSLAASAERYSEHPLAEAVRLAARMRGLELTDVEQFEAVPGLGVRARINDCSIRVGNRRFFSNITSTEATDLEAQGKSLLFVARDDQIIGILAASDTLRDEVPAALQAIRTLGFNQIELLTGDNERSASVVAAQCGIPYRANLLPEDKIRIVKDYQAQNHRVVMVGDGVNDAPALAQADIGIAMGAAGSDVAIEAAHIALMRDDWALVPEVIRIARRTMRVVKMNIGFTAVYNLVGLTLAAFGILPPILAAAAQSLPDLGILGNSSRLLRQQKQKKW
jgi:Cd2+/Zn2+-exporting ATPase/Cu+-exporting ATPase